jgi:hypothetical protein
MIVTFELSPPNAPMFSWIHSSPRRWGGVSMRMRVGNRARHLVEQTKVARLLRCNFVPVQEAKRENTVVEAREDLCGCMSTR